MTTVKDNRLGYIDIIKGIAIILVVAGHFTPMGVSVGSFGAFRNFFYVFHMPLFMIASGFLFGLSARITSVAEYKTFLKKKFFRLAVPYCVISLVFILIKALASRFVKLEFPAANVAYHFFINPMGGAASFLWFLYTLMVIFLVFPLLTGFICNKWVLGVILFELYFIPLPELFSLNYVGQFLFYFWCGYALNSRKEELTKTLLTVLAGAALVLFIVHRFQFVRLNEVLTALLGCALSWMIALVLQSFGRLARFFAMLGIYSIAIYLLHTMAMGPFKVLFHGLMNRSAAGFFGVLGMAVSAGIFVPIVITKYGIARSRVLSRSMLGMEPETFRS